MAATTAADLARDAFMSSDYELACKLFEGVLAEQSAVESPAGQSSSQPPARSQRLSLYYGYGDSLARAGRLKDALDVYGHISGTLLDGLIPLERLRHLTSSLVETVLASRAVVATCSSPAVDPLCCPICEDILRLPVTATCGHTFCRQCCFGHSSCPVCHTQFPTVPSDAAAGPSSTITLLSLPAATATSSSSSTEELAGTSASASGGGKRDSVIGFEQDILIRRLVERWWGPELKAAELNEEAQRYLDDGGGGGGDGGEGLDEALRCCNQSLENAPNSYKGLLLRAEVLYRLQHYQSALADADSALKSRPTSHKAHYLRALALSALGKPEAAITAHCVALFLDKQSVSVASGIRQEIAKDLQQLLAAVGTHREPELPLALRDPLALLFGTPYSLMSSRKRRHHRILSAHKHKAKKQYATLRTADFDDVDHSDEDEEDSYLRAASLLDEMDDEEGFLRSAMMNPPHHRRKSLTAYNLSFFSTQRQQQDRFRRDQSTAIIPRPNARLRAFVDRMSAELESVRWTAETAPVRLTVSPSAIEPSDFDCVLCCRTLWRPVVTPCGHTYCWVCLDRCMDYSPSCPLCMAPLIEQFRHHHQRTPNLQSLLATAAASNPTLISLSKRKVTSFVEQAMQRFIPEAYEKRQRQELDREPTVPVFICTTAFPSVPCPLFVYEPRYKLMVRRAIESGERQFGIALPQAGRQRYVEYGTMLDIRDCVQLGDGCSILSTVGSRRFRVIARHEQDGYDTANVEFIEDEPDSWEVVRKLHEKVHEKAIGWHESLQERKKSEIAKSFGRMPTLEENWERLVDGPAWAWWIIAILPLSEQLKVNILSTTSLEKRLRAIDKTLNLAPQKQRRSPVYVVPSSPASPPPVGCCDVVVGGVTSTTSLHQQHAHHQSPNHHHHHHHQHHQSQQHHEHHHEQCQAIDCCLRERTTSADSADHHHHHHHESDRNSSGGHHHHHHHHSIHHLSQSADAGDYLL